MPVKVRCKGCQKVLNAPDKARGKVIQCPECGTKLKVPEGEGGGEAPAKSAKAAKPAKKKEPSPGDSDEFLTGLNVDQLESEHGDLKVCPYCAADMDAAETICRKCGMNTATGQMDAKEAKKRARKGADPALFYKAAWSDSWEFVQQYWRLGMKTSMVWTTFLTIVLTCVFMARTWVFSGEAPPADAPAVQVEGEEPAAPVSPWRSPGFFFWAGLGFVMFLGIPGWFWSLALKIIDATMQKEEIKEDRIQYDMFEAVALGFRLIFWPAIVMLPLAPVFGAIAFTMGIVSILQGGGALGTGLSLLLVSYFVMPYLFFPQAMVHMTVRHRFKAWILWDQLICFFKNAPATIYWWIVAIIVWLPIIVIAALVGLNLTSVFEWTYAKLDQVAAWMFGFMMDVGTPEERGLFFTILFTGFLPVAMGLISAPLAYLAGFPAVFLMRAIGLYGYYRRETLGLVTHVSTNQPAGFWVRFLCRAIDYGVVLGFWIIMFQIPFFMVASEFPLGRYFGGGMMAAVNVGYVAIAGSKSAKASMIGVGLGVLAGVTFIYGETIEIFQLVFNVLYYAVPAYNVGMSYVVNEASTSRSTIGKEAFGLITQTVEKQKEMSVQQAFVRHIGRMLSDALLGLPYLMSAFNAKKQALHDVMAKAEVVFRGDK